ncbi:MAG TPA: EAL domain-containing protein [Xanthomonadaceae bacterium]|jgi:diguanylate cyclase (GGDEF)-like protein/PAS domain S-box-containing protein|nr:EAL domain-containing protein [Xanthomonadaceae bacterium]
MELSLNETAFHQTFERITDAYVALDVDWRYTYANAKACELIGCPASELIGESIWTEFHETNGHPFRHACEKAMAEQRPVFLEAFYERRGSWFESHIHPSPDGATIYFIDITERKRMEEDLLHHQNMLDEAQQAARMGSWEWEIASNKVTWSSELYRIYGLDPGQYAATFEGYLALVHPLDRTRVQGIIQNACVDHARFEFDERIVRADGSVRTLHSNGMVVTDAQGKPIRMLGACQDISERRRYEQMEAAHHEILEGIAAQRPLAESLERIARLHEELNPDALCSVLLIDDEGEHVLHGAGPSLPAAYNQSIHGMAIGEAHGSCGTAAARGERVVVEDIATHPYWKDYRGLATAHGLKACWSTPVLGHDGHVLGTFAVYYRDPRSPTADELRDIDRMLPITATAIESARQSRRMLERDRFFELSTEIYCIFDPASERIVQANPSFSHITGYSAEELASRHYQEFVHPDDRGATANAVTVLNEAGGRISAFAYRFHCKDGSYRWLEWESVVAADGLAYAAARDITERRKAEAELAYVASHDVVTGLPHHLVFERTLAGLLADPTASVWLFFIGLDRFQTINESMGHVIGDELLQTVGERLRATLGDDGQIARFTGDEFVIASTTMDRTSAMALADRLRDAVARPIERGGYRLLLTASIGISHSPEHGHTAKELLRRAEAAMTRAKRQGRDSVCEFSIEQMQDIEDRLVLGSHLRGAIRRGELELHYQPHRRASDRALTGFEALLRWNSKELGRTPPARFIPIAESLGLMPEIGAWIVDEACRQMRAWMDRGHHGFTIAVNVSAQQLQRHGLVDQVRAALQRHAVPAEALSIELTESSLMENVLRVRDTLAELKALGTTLALDDFGTGYSSLSYLKQFPIDKLKIDQSFVRGLPDDVDDATIARTIVAMAHQLRMVVASEGIETEAQAAFLTDIGCDELQGFYLGHPVVAEEAEAFFPRQ